MNMAGAFAQDFAGSRPLARHCSELTWRGPRPEEREGAIAVWKRDLAGEMAQELGQMLQGEKLEVTISGPNMMTGQAVFDKIGDVAVNTLMRIGTGDQTVLLSLDYSTAIALTDCSFGGEGSPPDSVPSKLPRSAGLLVEQFAASIAQVIAMAKAPGEPARGDVLVRSESVVRLKPFSAEAEIVVLDMTMVQGAFVEWKMLIAFAADQLDELLPASKPARSPSSKGAGPGNDADPYACVPLELEAVLSEIEMPLGQLERLVPGDEIPLKIPKELTLRIGHDVFAHGVPGTFENQMALRLTRVPHQSSGGARPQAFASAAPSSAAPSSPAPTSPELGGAS